MNKLNRFLMLWIALALCVGMTNAHALPPQAEADMLMIQAKAAMEAKNYTEAVQMLARVQELDVTLPLTFSYHYGNALANAGEFEQAKQQLELYITKEGSSGKFYKEALEAYSGLEAKQAEVLHRKELAREEEARRTEQEEKVASAKRAFGEKIDSEMIPIPGKNYALGKYEVTEGVWKVVMGDNPSEFKNCGDQCPVENISWEKVQMFLQKLNALTGKHYRLPSEEEWEYACYGGKKTEYCGGDNLDAVAWYSENSGGHKHPVGQKQPNGYGLYDMSGNIHEWMSNTYVEHNGPALRGGAWGFESKYSRVTFRYGSGWRTVYRGFRLARDW